MKAKSKHKTNRKGGKAITPTTPPETPRRAPIVAVSRESRMIDTASLIAAPWNPRPTITPESVADLAASITTVGIIEPLVVMTGAAPGKYIIIAGHRRLEAARVAGLAAVPCDILAGIDEPSARRMTFIENLQRQDADPLLESKLVDQLIKDGMTAEEIAAETGRGAKWVARRKRLSCLSGKWRKFVELGLPFTTDALEHIAAHPVEMQDRIGDNYGLKYMKQIAMRGAIRWSELETVFARQSLSLKGAAFDCTACRTCPNNSATTPDLFDFAGGRVPALGSCLDQGCYWRKVSARHKTLLEDARCAGLKVVTLKHSYDIPYDVKDEFFPGARIVYTAADYDGHPVIKYGKKESNNQLSATQAHAPTAKELAERKEKRERNKAIRKLAEWCAQGEPGEPCNLAAHIRDWCSDLNGIKPAAAFAVNAAFLFVRWSSYDFVGTDSTTRDVARSALFGNLVIPSQWPNQVSAKIIESLNPSSNDWVAKNDALLVLRMLGDRAAELLGADVVSAILPKDADAASFRNPPIKWRGGDDKEKENAE